MKTIKISLLTCLALLFATGLFAQRGRGGYNNYHSNRNYHHRSYVSVNVGPRYNYRPYYRPAPVYSYRPAYRPVYRNPGAYIHFGPVFGFRLNVLPFGYSRIYVGGSPYFYNEGVYYRSYSNNSYEVVAPPLNATVNKLPSNAAVTVIDGQKYYQVGGTFYQEEIAENNKRSYRVVGTDGVINTDNNTNDEQQLNADNQEIPTLGSRYDELPAESRVQVINQQKYFSTPGGIYYKEVIEGDKIRYEVTNVQ
jgi:Family of unknown function (DUF6515)